MRALLYFCFLLSAFRVWGAAGDVVQVDINTNGWAYVYIEDWPTNATFDNGFLNHTNYSGTNEIWHQSPSLTNGLRIDLFSIGYDNSVRVMKPRTVYGTKMVRKPYTNHAQADIFTNGGSPNIAKIHVALSDFVYDTDSNVLATVHTHGFMSGATPCNGTNAIAVVNGSTIVEWSPVVMHTRAIMQRITSTTMPLSLVAFAHDGIDSVQFVAQGATSGLAVTNTVTRMVPARNRNTKGLRWAEYQADMNLAALTAGEQVRVDYTVWPRIGTNFSTFWNLYPMLSNQPTAYTNLYDPSDNQASWIAVVDMATGDDTNGRTTNTTPANVDAAHYFATIPTALVRSGASNSWAGGMVYVRTGTTNIGGSNPTFSAWKSHPVLRPYPGDTLIIETNSTTASLSYGGFLQIRDATIAGIGATANAYAINARRLWLSNCIINTSHAAPFRSFSAASNCVILVEDSIVQRQTPTGFRQFGSEQQVSYHSVGNEFNGFTNEFQAVLAVGNLMTNTASTNLNLSTDSTGVAVRQHLIWFNNRFHAIFGTATGFLAGGGFAALTNCAFVQNEFEGIKLDGSNGKQFAFSSSTLAADGVLWHHNTVLGPRGIIGYNTSTTGYRFKRFSLRNNNFMANGWVTDTDLALPSADAVGNWLHMWHTGHRGNVIPNTHAVTHGAAEYAHFESYYRPVAQGKSNQWWSFVSPAWVYSSGENGDPSPGNGNYRFRSDAPAHFIPTVPLLDYDIEVVHRGHWDPPGTHASGTTKKGGGFF